MNIIQQLLARARISAAGFFVVLAMLPALVHSHGAPGAVIKARPDALPEVLSEVTVQVHVSVTAQIIVENDTEQVLAIEDANGRPFIRISNAGVYADKHAQAYYQVRAPTTGDRVPKEITESNDTLPARWIKVNEGASWGWFDPRIDGDNLEVPHEIEDAAQTARLSDWNIPVRYGDTETQISGGFFYEPLQIGRLVSRIVSGTQPTADVQIGIVQGPLPSLSVTNRGSDPVIVLDGDGHPRFRVGDGVYRSTASDNDNSQWVRIGGGHRHSWIEPRAAYSDRNPPAEVIRAGKPHKLQDWRISILVGETQHQVRGEVYWLPELE